MLGFNTLVSLYEIHKVLANTVRGLIYTLEPAHVGFSVVRDGIVYQKLNFKFFFHKIFLELHSETAVQHSTEQVMFMGLCLLSLPLSSSFSSSSKLPVQLTAVQQLCLVITSSKEGVMVMFCSFF